MSKRLSGAIATAVLIGFALTGVGVRAEGRDRATGPYPYQKIKPIGFQVYGGILDWVPVSTSKSVVFARNKNASTYEYSLISLQMNNKGAMLSPHTIASGLGVPRALACVWATSANGGRATSDAFGLVFVLFETTTDNPQHDTATVYSAKFDAKGQLVGTWRPLVTIETPKDTYISNEGIFASVSPDSVGVTPSILIYDLHANTTKSVGYFIEIHIRDGSMIGLPVALPLPQSGRWVDAFCHAPVWNGTSWLVPTGVVLHKSPGAWDAVIGNQALVYTITGRESRSVTSRLIAKDATHEYRPYESMSLTPYPQSSTDSLLFVKQAKPVPEDQQKQDYCTYDFALKRLDKTGKVLKGVKLQIPGLTHVVPYDPAYKPRYPDDSWSALLARGSSLYTSRAHGIELVKTGSADEIYEQQFDLYRIDAVSGAVELRAQSFLRLKQWFVLDPLIRALSSHEMAVVNNLWLYVEPYPRTSYWSKFNY